MDRGMENLIFGSLSVVIAGALFAGAYLSFRKDRIRWSLALIILGGLVLRIFVATDGYLHTWDEKYHALVAKNLLSHPLKPTLYDDPVWPYHYQNWTANHIWLEKGPVPLWFMAASIGLFGDHEFAVRIPSLILSLLGIYLTFLIASALFDKKTALLAAFFHAINGMIIELAGGRVSSDHVETFFIGFVELGIFFSMIYTQRSGRSAPVIWIGLFTGLAFLSKWYPAFLVYLVWIAGAIFAGNISARKLMKHVLLALAVTAGVVLPYLVYIIQAFPGEASWTIKRFLLFYGDTVETHGAPAYYYLHKIGRLFGELIYIPLAFSGYQIIRNKAGWAIKWLSVWWILPVVIFSLAETKRMTYLVIAAPAFFILLSRYWHYFYAQRPFVRYKWVLNGLLLLLLALPVRYGLERVKPFDKRIRNPVWTKELKKLSPDPSGKVVLFNVEHHIEAMFYTGYTVYDFIPPVGDILRLQKQGYRIMINDKGDLKNDYFEIENLEIIKLKSAGDGRNK